MFVQIVNLFLTAKCMVTCERDDLYSRSHNQESHIKTNLVIASSSRTVCDSIGFDLICISCDGDSLEDTL